MWWWIPRLFFGSLICFVLGLITACLAALAYNKGEEDLSSALYAAAVVSTIPLMSAIVSVLVWFVAQVFMRICGLYM